MFLTTDTAAALVHARNDEKDLGSVKAGVATSATSGKVGGPLESLAAVIPTGITAIYTAFAALAQTQMVERGTEERAAFEAAQEELGTKASVIAEKLKAMPLESKDLIEYRWGVLALAAIVALVLGVRAVQKGNESSEKKRSGLRLAFEPVTGVVALVGWGLAAPGSPLGAYLSADDATFFRSMILAAASLLLLGLGSRLTAPAQAQAQAA